jgi:hypothetical protein
MYVLRGPLCRVVPHAWQRLGDGALRAGESQMRPLGVGQHSCPGREQSIALLREGGDQGTGQGDRVPAVSALEHGSSRMGPERQQLVEVGGACGGHRLVEQGLASRRRAPGTAGPAGQSREHRCRCRWGSHASSAEISESKACRSSPSCLTISGQASASCGGAPPGRASCSGASTTRAGAPWASPAFRGRGISDLAWA